jgi:hypothetical protein
MCKEFEQHLDVSERKLDTLEEKYKIYQEVAKMLADELEHHLDIYEDSPALIAYRALVGDK